MGESNLAFCFSAYLIFFLSAFISDNSAFTVAPSCFYLDMLVLHIVVVLSQVLSTTFHHSKQEDYCKYEFSFEYHRHMIGNKHCMESNLPSSHQLEEKWKIVLFSIPFHPSDIEKQNATQEKLKYMYLVWT